MQLLRRLTATLLVVVATLCASVQPVDGFWYFSANETETDGIATEPATEFNP